MKRLFVLVLTLACSRSQATADPSASTAASSTSAAPCGTLGGSCSKEGESCSPAPIGTGWSHMLQCHSGKWTELEIAPLPTPATATVAASTSAQGRTQAAPRSLPKVDVSCNADTDCTVTSEEIQDNPPQTYACCSGCSSHAVNTTWLQTFRAACAQQPAPMCPPIGCAMAITKAACKNHRCEVVTPKP